MDKNFLDGLRFWITDCARAALGYLQLKAHAWLIPATIMPPLWPE